MRNRKLTDESICIIELAVAGMTCANCERRVETALEAVPGVRKASADARRGRARVHAEVRFREDAGFRQVLAAAVVSAGYAATQAPPDIKENRRDGLIAAAAGLGIAGLFTLAGSAGLLASAPVPNGNSAPGMLFVIGLLTGLHCVSMCGGIALSQGLKGASAAQPAAVRKPSVALAPSLAYNAGRVVSYTLVGTLVGALGGVLDLGSRGRAAVMALAGLFMILMGLRLGGILRPSRFRLPFLDQLRGRAGSLAATAGPFAVGLANGLMPCGPLQALQLYALGTGSAAAGASAMFLFSLGTVPVLLVFGAGGALLPQRLRTGAIRAGAVLVAFLGLASLGRAWALSGLGSSSASAVPGSVSAARGSLAAPLEPPLSPEPAPSADPSPLVARREGKVQVVEFDLSPRRYAEFVVQAGVPVRWIIRAAPGTVNGCNNQIIVPSLGLEKPLVVGENVIEFTPGGPGVVPYSCWMGMIRSRFTVVADLSALAP